MPQPSPPKPTMPSAELKSKTKDIVLRDLPNPLLRAEALVVSNELARIPSKWRVQDEGVSNQYFERQQRPNVDDLNRTLLHMDGSTKRNEQKASAESDLRKTMHSASDMQKELLRRLILKQHYQDTEEDKNEVIILSRWPKVTMEGFPNKSAVYLRDLAGKLYD